MSTQDPMGVNSLCRVFLRIIYTSLSSGFDQKGGSLMWCGDLRTSPLTRGLKTAFPEMKVSSLLCPSLACQRSLTLKSGFPGGKRELNEGRLERNTGKNRTGFLTLGERKKDGPIRRFATCQVTTRGVSVSHDSCIFVRIVHTSLNWAFDHNGCAPIGTFGC